MEVYSCDTIRDFGTYRDFIFVDITKLDEEHIAMYASGTLYWQSCPCPSSLSSLLTSVLLFHHKIIGFVEPPRWAYQ